MRTLTLSLAGRVVDLPANLKGLIRLTQARAALADLESRVGEYSWPITLPPTRVNARVFGVNALHPLGLGKFAGIDFPYELRCEAQIFAGTFRLTSLKGGYTGQLLGQGFSWALELGEKKLTDLRFPEVPYNGTQLPGILALDCDTTDLQFPLLSFGNFFAPPLNTLQRDGSTKEVPSPPAAVLDYPLSVDDYPPGVYHVNVLRRIFAEIGWSLSGRVLDEPQWRQTVLTCAGADVDKAWPWGALLPASANNGGIARDAYSYFDTDPLNTGSRYSNTAVGWDDAREVFFLPVPTPGVLSSPTRALAPLTATYTAPIAGVYAFSWSATCTILQQTVQNRTGFPNFQDQPPARGFRAVGIGLVVFRGGEGFADADGGLCTTGDYAAGQDRVVSHGIPVAGQSASGSVTGLYLEPGDVVRFCLFAQRRLASQNGTILLIRQELYAQFSATAFACTSYADNEGLSQTSIQPSAFLPPLLQKDVVRDFLKRTDTVPVADASRRTVHLLSREEQAQAAGPVLDLSALLDPDSLSFEPTCGAGIGALVFAGPGSEDPLTPAGTDTVRVVVGPASGESTVTTLFAPVARRDYRLTNGGLAPIPTISTQAALDTPRSETAWDIAGQTPRLVRYTGPHATITVPFGTGTLPLATAVWDGVLAWSGPLGAVATYYADTVRAAQRGHVAKASLNLTPALYRALLPGRRVQLPDGALYRLSAVNTYDLGDEANATACEFLREV